MSESDNYIDWVSLFIFSRKHQGFVAAIEKELAALIVSAQNVSW